MTTPNATYVDAIDHLPTGALLVFPKVSWEQYECLLAHCADRPGVRVSYDEGRLEVMSPSAEHEEYKDFVLRVAQALSDELGLPLETRGSTTWKRKTFSKGAEADACFYVTNAHRVVGRRKIDLELDPPPDIVVEIDATNESLGKFPIYAAFRVPEIWRYDGTRVHMYALTGENYVERPDSQFFPGLTSRGLAESLEMSKTLGQTQALRTVRQRIRDRSL